MVDTVERHVVHVADGDGSKHVVQIVGSNEVGLYLHPFADVTCIVILFAPAEFQEWCARYYFAAYQYVFVVALTVVVDVGCARVPGFEHLHQVLVVAIYKDGTVVGYQEVVEFSLCLADTLKRAETLQVGAPHVGDEAACRLCRLYQCLDVTGV